MTSPTFPVNENATVVMRGRACRYSTYRSGPMTRAMTAEAAAATTIVRAASRGCRMASQIMNGTIAGFAARASTTPSGDAPSHPRRAMTTAVAPTYSAMTLPSTMS